MRRKLLPILIWLGMTAPAAGDPPSQVQERSIKQADRQHWAFCPPVHPPIPTVRESNWVRTPIDAFILAKLEAAGLGPARQANQLTLLRRVTVDLIGLPPSIEEQDSFLNDSGPDAYERVVERLLASPHYGERWTQHWLDVVRYAESNGYEADSERPHAWHYRDYIVRSFNSDKSFSQFVREQLAGDLLAKNNDKLEFELWVATGFHRCGPMHFITGNTDPEVNRQEILTEMVNGVGSAFLGLTVSCARCHDHKFDPVSAADYYRMQAFFAGTQMKDRDMSSADEKSVHAKITAALQAKITPLKAKVAALDAPHQAKLTEKKRAALEPKYRNALAVPEPKRSPGEKQLAAQATTLIKVTWDEIVASLRPEELAQRKAWRDEIHELEAQLPPPPPQAWSVADDDKIPPTHVLRRGDVKRKDVEVLPAFPRVLVSVPSATSSRRLTRVDLANWLASPDHPLTARVWVNRLWQHHFGRGLVATPNDFGCRGEKPTHPELLDWLATEFTRTGCSTKSMHRLMVLSATYRQASNSKIASADPENHLMSRMNRRRLEGEALRDALLATAGTLNRQMTGPPVCVPLESEVYDLIFTEGEPDGLWKVTPDERQHSRRSLYLFAKRNLRQPLLEAFDQPDTLNSCPLRPASIFAPQALILMNGPLAQAQSKQIAARLLRDSGGKGELAIERAFRLALSRPPRLDEQRAVREFIEKQSKILRERLLARLRVTLPPGTADNGDPAVPGAFVDFALALINSNEFVYVD